MNLDIFNDNGVGISSFSELLISMLLVCIVSIIISESKDSRDNRE